MDFRAYKGELPPGRTDLPIEWPGGMFIRFAVELAFRDAAGRNWLRTTEGELKRVRTEAVERYGLVGVPAAHPNIGRSAARERHVAPSRRHGTTASSAVRRTTMMG